MNRESSTWRPGGTHQVYAKDQPEYIPLPMGVGMSCWRDSSGCSDDARRTPGTPIWTSAIGREFAESTEMPISVDSPIGGLVALTRQAKCLAPAQREALVAYAARQWRGSRNAVIVRLNFELGLRAKEIACARWRMVLDVRGRLGEQLALENAASKGDAGGRDLPLTTTLRATLERLYRETRPRELDAFIVQFRKHSLDPVIRSAAVQECFRRWYRALGYHGASSHSGRRTAITETARLAPQLGLSLRDVQLLAGHSSIATTQRYIEPNRDRHRELLERLAIQPKLRMAKMETLKQNARAAGGSV